MKPEQHAYKKKEEKKFLGALDEIGKTTEEPPKEGKKLEEPSKDEPTTDAPAIIPEPTSDASDIAHEPVTSDEPREEEKIEPEKPSDPYDKLEKPPEPEKEEETIKAEDVGSLEELGLDLEEPEEKPKKRGKTKKTEE